MLGKNSFESGWVLENPRKPVRDIQVLLLRAETSGQTRKKGKNVFPTINTK